MLWLTVCDDRYGLVTEQRKGAYRYFIDEEDGMKVVNVKTDWIDNVRSTQPCFHTFFRTADRLAGHWKFSQEGENGVRNESWRNRCA